LLNSSSLRQIELPIEGMTYAACAARIEKNLNKPSGVQASINFANEKAYVNYDEKQVNTGTLINTIEHAGFHIAPRSCNFNCTKWLVRPVQNILRKH
jgi:Cu+-exporting ATPase